MVCQCLKCSSLFRFTTSEITTINGTNHYDVNIGAALGQIATGGGAEYMKEQLACFQVPSLSTPSFIDQECDTGTIFKETVTEQLLIAGQKEEELAIQRGSYHNTVPAITVVVDGGWSKRSHGHSYIVNSGVGVILGAATKGLLFIGVRNKHCSICAINARRETPIPEYNCFRNWSGNSCSMEADIILEGFQLSEQMHGVQHCWLIGDGDSSVYYVVVSGVPSYGIVIKKVECANHAMKCYRNRLEGVCNDKPAYHSKQGLSKSMMKRITHGARCAIKMHSATGDMAALLHDLRNGPRHYFRLHDRCSSTFCKHKDILPSGKVYCRRKPNKNF